MNRNPPFRSSIYVIVILSFISVSWQSMVLASHAQDILIEGPATIPIGGQATYSAKIKINGTWQNFTPSHCHSASSQCLTWSASYSLLTPTQAQGATYTATASSQPGTVNVTVDFAPPFLRKTKTVTVFVPAPPQSGNPLPWLPAVLGVILE